MNTLISHKEFIKMRDQGKFSKKFEGKHSYFLYLEPEVEKKKLEVYIRNDDYQYLNYSVSILRLEKGKGVILYLKLLFSYNFHPSMLYVEKLGVYPGGSGEIILKKVESVSVHPTIAP